MPAEDVPKNRGWFRKILTLGRGNLKDSEKPETDAESGETGSEGNTTEGSANGKIMLKRQGTLRIKS